jgi:cation diffusion facilitator CzcD-associated flavoprotein CzcO
MKTPTKKNTIIIGAGIGGLSAGSYTQISGFNTEIFEMRALASNL